MILFGSVRPASNPEVYEFLEAESYKYAIGLPANNVLQAHICYLLKRPGNLAADRRAATKTGSSVGTEGLG